MTQTLERAIAIAATAHAGQVDKGGAPYILHPLKVMLRMSSLEERIVAVLHDVVEDSGISLDDLRKEGFSEEVLSAIESVTKVPGESYEDFVERAAQNSIGRVVKLADLEENSDLSRIASPSWEDLERVEKYRRAIGRLRA
ncbi:HD domain-containing protein [Pseudomonas sp. NMS19W]|uniref:HD domain-containing protein n=1 Tax=Pseudomonas sp. NMS19W TaxID=3079768 RepID=UPI003F65F60F